MQQAFIYLFFVVSLLVSCNETRSNPTTSTKKAPLHPPENNITLLDSVKLAINPKYQDWVLFQNGTYIVFDSADTIPDLKIEAIKLMKEYGLVYAGSPAGDFGVIKLNKTTGGVVSGDCYGMYTYVNPTELSSGAQQPNDVQIGLLGRAKRDSDGKNPVIIHVNRKTEK